MTRRAVLATTIIALLMAVSLIAACGSSGDESDTSGDSPSASQEFCEKLEKCPAATAQLSISGFDQCEAMFEYFALDVRQCVAAASDCAELVGCLAAFNSGGGDDDDDDNDSGGDPFDDDIPDGYDLGDRLPNFRLTDSNGAEVELYDYAGLVVLLDSSAMWCPPCQQDTPSLETDFYQEYKDTGDGFIVLQLLGEDYGGDTPTTSDLSNWKSKYNLTFPVLADANWQVDRNLGNGYVPHYTTLDQQMVIQRKGNTLYSNHGTIRDLLGID
ncbi:MAG: TlpA disulfide reductase family protein [Candidatus Lernaella stagnicola]|nr:TlpA disulfide reductase family protein [Candidatus Lernaella stagnicola]